MDAWSPSPSGRHGHHDTQYRRDDTETGHAVGDAVHRVGRVLQLFLEAQQFHVEQAFQLMRGHVAGGHDAQVIADERGHALIFQHRRVLGEDRAGGGVFDVASMAIMPSRRLLLRIS
jgi:hypothetical protein